MGNFRLIILPVFFAAFNLVSAPAFAQQSGTPVTTRILFIFDASRSMTASLDGRESRMVIARDLLIEMIDSLENIDNVQVALRIYGHQSPVPPQDCSDTRLEVPFGDNNAERIRQRIRRTVPKGTTPIARSLEEAGNDFPPCNNCRNIIVLITDGIEACDGDPCAIALELFNKGITLKPFVIGIGLDVDFVDAFECMGDFYNTTSKDDFMRITHEVIQKSISGTTAQISLLNESLQPKETNVGITVYNAETGAFANNFVHTLNRRGNPDTLNLNPDIRYNITVHTIPEVNLKNVQLQKGIHNDIRANTPQGTLNVIQDKGLELQGVKYIVRKSGEMNSLHVGELFQPEKYIVGKYDLEILSLPRILISGVEIKQSQTNLLRIVQPGLVNLNFPSNGYASIYQISNDKVQLIKNLHMETGVALRLQPGRYLAVYRPQQTYSVVFSKEREFIIRSGQSINVDMR